jgi:hypothetical protein
MHPEADRVQPPNEFSHLPLGSARLEPGDEDRDRNLWRQVHTSHLSKGGATSNAVLRCLLWGKLSQSV